MIEATMFKNRKKGQVQGILQTVLGVGVLVVALVLLYVFGGAITGSSYQTVEADLQEIANTQIINESFTASNNTAVYLAHDFMQTGTLTIVNTTGHVKPLTIFTIDYDHSSLTLKVANDSFDGKGMKATYIYGDKTIRDNLMSGIEESFDAYSKGASYTPLFILAILMLVFLTVFGNMGGTNRGSVL
jgi:uncharacterized protein (UPF0333 family)